MLELFFMESVYRFIHPLQMEIQEPKLHTEALREAGGEDKQESKHPWDHDCSRDH